MPDHAPQPESPAAADYAAATPQLVDELAQLLLPLDDKWGMVPGESRRIADKVAELAEVVARAALAKHPRLVARVAASELVAWQNHLASCDTCVSGLFCAEGRDLFDAAAQQPVTRGDVAGYGSALSRIALALVPRGKAENGPLHRIANALEAMSQPAQGHACGCPSCDGSDRAAGYTCGQCGTRWALVEWLSAQAGVNFDPPAQDPATCCTDCGVTGKPNTLGGYTCPKCGAAWAYTSTRRPMGFNSLLCDTCKRYFTPDPNGPAPAICPHCKAVQ